MSTATSMSIARSSAKPLVFGVVGLGGYAGVVCDRLLDGSREKRPAVSLAAVCEPDPVQHAERLAQMRRNGVRVMAGVDELLASDVDAVWLPVPIHLHLPFTRQALAAGKAVLCEKPAAGCVDDVDAMIALRDANPGLPVLVGFQHIYDPAIAELKRAILSGAIGQVDSVTVRCCWPRDDGYYRRNGWAGRVRIGNAWVIDSPANNAMAHFINLALFLLGDTEGASATPLSVEAELYRVNPIECYDTCSLRIRAGANVPVLVLMTHASAAECGPVVTLNGRRGTVRITDMARIEYDGAAALDGPRRLQGFEQLHTHMQRAFAGMVRGVRPDGPVATLEVARAHAVAAGGASEAARIRTVPQEHVTVSKTVDGGTLRTLPGIEQMFEQCAAKGKMLHESGLAPWAARAGYKDLRGYRAFAGPKDFAGVAADVVA